MMQRVIAGTIVVALAIGIWILWPRSDNPDTTSTSVLAARSTTEPATDPTAPPTIAPGPTTSTTITETGVVETVEQAEAILRELWFGWFEGIYNQDEDRIREVVATEEQVDAAVAQFGVMEFSMRPRLDAIELERSEILRASRDCLALWAELDVSAIRVDAKGSQGVYVLRNREQTWYLLSVWPNRGDLWEADCEALLDLSS